MKPEPGASARSMDWKGVALVTLCCALWGGNPIAVKYSVPDIPPIGCAGLRYLIGLPVALLACRLTSQSMRFPARHGKLVALHTFLTVIQIGSFNLGTSLSLAGRASVFINVHPLVVAPLSAWLLRERLGLRGIAGLSAAATGVLILISSRIDFTGSGWIGDLIVLASGVIFGIQTVVQKQTFPLIAPATLLVWQSVGAIPIFMALSWGFEGIDAYHFTRMAVLGLLYQGLAVTGICFTLWLLLLRRYPASQLAALAFLSPLFGVGFGSLFRGEPLTWELVIAGVLVGIGIVLVSTDRVRLGRPNLAVDGPQPVRAT
jgi:drug/metabolite transporter (DMT)-like permease